MDFSKFDEKKQQDIKEVMDMLKELYAMQEAQSGNSESATAENSMEATVSENAVSKDGSSRGGFENAVSKDGSSRGGFENAFSTGTAPGALFESAVSKDCSSRVGFENNSQNEQSPIILGANGEPINSAPKEVIIYGSNGQPIERNSTVENRNAQAPTSPAERQVFTQSEPAKELEEENKVIDSMSAFEEAMKKVYDSVEMMDARKSAVNSERTDLNTVLYKDSTYTKADGTEVKYKRAVCHANWGSQFYENLSDNDRSSNYYKLCEEVTKSIEEYFGGFDRIRTICVQNDELIINDIAYTPRMLNLEENAKKFPFDTYEYIKTGRIAPLFCWTTLLSMPNLRDLSVSTVEFANDYIAADLGYYTLSIPHLFSSLKCLSTVTIAGETVYRDNPSATSKKFSNKTSKESVEDSLEREGRFRQFYSDFNWNIYNATDSVQNFFVGSLSDYAKNRGTKNWFRYGIGVVARSVGAVASTAVNAFTHLVGGTLKLGKAILKDGMTPIDRT